MLRITAILTGIHEPGGLPCLLIPVVPPNVSISSQASLMNVLPLVLDLYSNNGAVHLELVCSLWFCKKKRVIWDTLC